MSVRHSSAPGRKLDESPSLFVHSQAPRRALRECGARGYRALRVLRAAPFRPRAVSCPCRISRIRLAPGGERGTYFQPFEIVTGLEVERGNLLTMSANGTTTALFELGQDYYPM